MDALVAAAIHDAKNELSALGVWISEAQREFAAHSATPSPALDRAMAVATTLSGQLVELLALYRAGEGSLRLTVADHYLDDFLTDLIAELNQSRPMSQDSDGDATAGRELQLLTDFSATGEISTWAFDAYLVKFALLDALRNALRRARSQICLRFAAEEGGGVRFEVEDDGAGYPDQILHGESALAMATGSSGLGLTFARLIAARHATPAGHHGQLRLSNDGMASGGARFSLILP